MCSYVCEVHLFILLLQGMFLFIFIYLFIIFFFLESILIADLKIQGIKKQVLY